MDLARPTDLFDRVHEWSALSTIAQPSPHTTGLRIGIVSGRRRHGKSFVLRRLVEARGGIYHQARELEKSFALDLFAQDVADHLGYAPEALRFDSWETAFRVALGLTRPSVSNRRPAGADLLVLDELPYLLGQSPEIPSVLQLLYDEAANSPSGPSPTVVVCGSALSVMKDLLTGSMPLRGRAQLDLPMPPFDFRESREYWGIEDPLVAFHLDAVLGGTPGYRPLVTEPPPASMSDWVGWLGRTLLNPAAALFDEKAHLLREDPRNLDRGLYNSILLAVANGKHSPSAIAAAVGRDYNGLKHPLGILESTGFLQRTEDVLTVRRPVYRLADPIVRFAQVVVEPQRKLLEEREVESAWNNAAAPYSAQVLGPHFEHLARVWTSKYSGDRWTGTVGEIGSAVVNDAAGRSQHEIDVVALARGDRRHDQNATITVLGEAKSSNRQRTRADLERLESVRELLVRNGRNAENADLALFSREGFEENLREVGATRPDVHLVNLSELYEG